MYKKSKKLLVLCLVVSMLLTNILAVSAFAETRHSGADRYATAAAIAATFEEADTAILATGVDYPDALCAAPLAKALNAPILLTEKNSLSTDAKDALEDLGVEKVIIVGGTAAVSQAVEDKLAEDYTVERLAGDDRIATSLAIAEALADEVDEITEVMLATAANYPDALSASPIAADLGMPILLTNKDSVADDVVEFIGDAKVYVLGGTAVISDKVADLFDEAERLGGADRYATNYAIMNAFAEDLDWSKVYVATGENFPDALAGSVVAAGYPLVLVSSSLSSDMTDLLEENVSAGTEVTVFGGTSAVSASVVKKIEAIIDGGTVTAEKVEATTESVDNSTAGQVLEFKVDGKTQTVKSMENKGYTVTFVSDDDVFNNTPATVSQDGVLSVYRLTDIYNDSHSVTDRCFTYQVQILEDDTVVAVSGKKSVKIVDEVSVADDITAVHVYRDETDDALEIEISSGKLVRFETYYIGEVEAEVEGVAIDDLTVAEGYDVSFETSNSKVVTVDEWGNITPRSEGKATITVASGDASYDLDVEVVSGARVAKTVELDTTEIKIAQGVAYEDAILVTATILDQYGDPKDNVDFDAVARFNEEVYNSNGRLIANVDDIEDEWESNADGEVQFTIDTDDIDNTGTGTLQIVDKVTNKVFDTLKVTTKVAGTSAASYKLLDKDSDAFEEYDATDETEYLLYLYKYDSEGFYLGKDRAEDTDAEIDFNGQNLVTLTRDQFDHDATVGFEIKGNNKKGTAIIYAKRGDLILATYKAIIEDTPDDTLEYFTFQDLTVTGTNAGPFNLRKEIVENAILSTGGRYYFKTSAWNTVEVWSGVSGEDSQIATIVMDANLRKDGMAWTDWWKYVNFEGDEDINWPYGDIDGRVELVFDPLFFRGGDEQFDAGVSGTIHLIVYKGTNTTTSDLLTTFDIDVDVK